MAIRLSSRARAYIRRAKQHGVAFEEFEPEEIFARDDLVCMSWPGQPCDCGKQASIEVESTHPDFATLGHFPAMCNGGPHFRANVFTQRWECNARQNNAIDQPTRAKINRQAQRTGPQSEKAKAAKRPWPSRPFQGSRGFGGAVKRVRT